MIFFLSICSELPTIVRLAQNTKENKDIFYKIDEFNQNLKKKISYKLF